MRTRVPVLVFRSGPHKIGVQSELSPHKYTNTSAHTHTHTHTNTHTLTHTHTHTHTHTLTANVQRFEPHLRHNWLSCGVFLVKSRHFGLPLVQTIRPNCQSLRKRTWRGRYTEVSNYKHEETTTFSVQV